MSQAILVVDDDEMVGQVLTRVLARDGYAVILAATAAQAIRLACEFHPQLALLDVCLEDGDGVQLGRDLRAMMPDLGLVLMTASPVPVEEHSERGVARVLIKPLDLAHLRQTITAVLAELADGAVCATCAAAQHWAAP